MNEIVAEELSQDYFSNINIAGTTFQHRMAEYNAWKLNKLKEIKFIEEKALNHEAYLACGEDSCGLKIAKMRKVGGISK